MSFRGGLKHVRDVTAGRAPVPIYAGDPNKLAARGIPLPRIADSASRKSSFVLVLRASSSWPHLTKFHLSVTHTYSPSRAPWQYHPKFHQWHLLPERYYHQ